MLVSWITARNLAEFKLRCHWLLSHCLKRTSWVSVKRRIEKERKGQMLLCKKIRPVYLIFFHHHSGNMCAVTIHWPEVAVSECEWECGKVLHSMICTYIQQVSIDIHAENTWFAAARDKINPFELLMKHLSFLPLSSFCWLPTADSIRSHLAA